MALNPNPIGEEIANYLQSNKPAAGSPVTDAKLIQIWQGIMALIYADLQANLGVAAGGFVVNGVQAGGDSVVVTGTGGPAL